MKNKKKTPEVVFAPGCFDDFDGTQEELDELMLEIVRLVETGEIGEQSREVDIDELVDEDPELAEKLLQSIAVDRKLQ
jgi:hypothetical protein